MTTNPTLLSFGAAIRERRRALGLTQVEVQDLAGLSPAFLYGLEHGKPTVRLDKVLAVLAVLGLSLELREGSEPLIVAAKSDEDGQGS